MELCGITLVPGNSWPPLQLGQNQRQVLPCTSSILSSWRSAKGTAPFSLCPLLCCPWDAKADIQDWVEALLCGTLTKDHPCSLSWDSDSAGTIWMSHSLPMGIYFPVTVYQRGNILSHSACSGEVRASQSMSILPPQKFERFYSYNLIIKMYSRVGGRLRREGKIWIWLIHIVGQWKPAQQDIQVSLAWREGKATKLTASCLGVMIMTDSLMAFGSWKTLSWFVLGFCNLSVRQTGEKEIFLCLCVQTRIRESVPELVSGGIRTCPQAFWVRGHWLRPSCSRPEQALEGPPRCWKHQAHTCCRSGSVPATPTGTGGSTSESGALLHTILSQ